MTRIPHVNLPGVSLGLSQLILGCDNKDTWEEGAPVWDHWLSVGGNAFDTAYVYGGGKHEKALGDWKWQNSGGYGTVQLKSSEVVDGKTVITGIYRFCPGTSCNSANGFKVTATVDPAKPHDIVLISD